MKRIALLLSLAAVVCYAADKKATQSAGKSVPRAAKKIRPVAKSHTKTAARPVARPAAKPAVAPVPLAIPKEAVEIDANTYRATTPDGKTWIYSRTPFGIARTEQRAPSAAEAAESARVMSATKAIERGDVVEFERPGPFGTYKWQRKKSELDAMEQAIWNRERQKSESAQAKQE